MKQSRNTCFRFLKSLSLIVDKKKKLRAVLFFCPTSDTAHCVCADNYNNKRHHAGPQMPGSTSASLHGAVPKSVAKTNKKARLTLVSH